MKEPEGDLARVCYFFQKIEVKFILIGARACALHGHIRATEDIDLLIQNDRDNIMKAIQAVCTLYPHLREELTVDDFYENTVIKILDEPELDLNLNAWLVTYEDAQKDRQMIVLEGVAIPYLGLESLIKSKTTEREQDKWDVMVLKEMAAKRKS